MITIKGFVTINSKVNNIENSVSPIGELSPKSNSYSMDRGDFTHVDYPSVRLTTFSTLDETGKETTLSQDFFNHALKIASWINSISTTGEITSVHNIADALEVDEIVVDNGTYMPTYIQWVFNGVTFKLWFTNDAFEAQYDESEFKVIAPMATLNDFHRPYSEVFHLVDSSVTVMLPRVNDISEESPYTKLQSVDVEWVDVATAMKSTATWLVAIYGEAGNNPDSIRNALVDYILENSDFTEAEWYNVFPLLFRPTEFVIVPAWHRYSMPDVSGTAGNYSPTIPYRDMLPMITQPTINYDAEHRLENMTCTTAVYKSLGLVSVGNIGNADGIFSLDEKFKDYLIRESDAVDYNEINPVTQNWMYLLHRMLIIAETMDVYTPLESGFSRLRRNDVTFLVSKYLDVNYLVVTKESFKDYFNEDTDTVS